MKRYKFSRQFNIAPNVEEIKRLKNFSATLGSVGLFHMNLIHRSGVNSSNKMRLSINQPAYIPWLGYFDRIDHADLHIVLDHVQFEKNSFINRNKMHSNLEPQWITIPVSKGKNGENSIKEIKTFNNKKWIKTHA